MQLAIRQGCSGDPAAREIPCGCSIGEVLLARHKVCEMR